MFPVLVKLNISISFAQWNSRGIQTSHIIRDLGVMSIMTSGIDCSVEQHLSPKSFCDTRQVYVVFLGVGWGVKNIYRIPMFGCDWLTKWNLDIKRRGFEILSTNLVVQCMIQTRN